MRGKGGDKKNKVNSLFIWALNPATMLQSIANLMDWMDTQTEICALQIPSQMCHNKSLNILLLLQYFSAYQTTLGKYLIKGKRIGKVMQATYICFWMQNIYQYPGVVFQALATSSWNSWMKKMAKIGEDKKSHRGKFNEELVLIHCMLWYYEREPS